MAYKHGSFCLITLIKCLTSHKSRGQNGNQQGSLSARLRPQSMTWDECKVYKNGVGAQYVQ